MAKRATRKQSQSRTRKAPARTTARSAQTRRAVKKTAKRATRRTKPAPARRKTAAKAAATPVKRRKSVPKQPSAISTAATAVKGALAGAVAAVTKRLPGATEQMDAITMLENEHRRLESLLKQGEETTERGVKSRTDLLDTITTELSLHELIEEEILYPALKQYPEARAIVLEGFQEHHVADLIVKELHAVAKDDERWGAKFKVLKENIEHHIQEEEGPMFRTARGVMTREELQALGVQMARMKAGAARGRA